MAIVSARLATLTPLLSAARLSQTGSEAVGRSPERSCAADSRSRMVNAEQRPRQNRKRTAKASIASSTQEGDLLKSFYGGCATVCVLPATLSVQLSSSNRWCEFCRNLHGRGPPRIRSSASCRRKLARQCGRRHHFDRPGDVRPGAMCRVSLRARSHDAFQRQRVGRCRS